MGVAGLVVLKKRIKSIENTMKLTKAMALVATSKLKKVRVMLYKNNSYFNSYKEVMNEIIPSLPKDNKYIKLNNKTEDKLIIVITSDMGMCGSYNYSVVNKVKDIISENEGNYKLLIVGEKGKSLFKRNKINTINFDKKLDNLPNNEDAKKIFRYGMDMFVQGLVSEVILVYTWFKNPIVKSPVHRVILPLEFESKDENYIKDEFDIEGDKEELMEILIPSYCNAMVFNGILNAKTAEQSYRMETMNSATKNASELISSLKIKYNRIRQGAITQEISEIVGGSQAQE